MPIKIVSDSVGLINLGITLAALVVIYFVFAGVVKKAHLEAYKQANEGLEKRDAEKNRRIDALESSQKVQEARIWRVEFESERRGLLLNNAREEIRLLEKIARVSLRFFADIPAGDHVREREEIQDVFKDLEEYRRQAAREMDDWEFERSKTMSLVNEKVERHAAHTPPEAAPERRPGNLLDFFAPRKR